MKIEIVDHPQDHTYTAKIYDGPDGIDFAEFECGSLGECFERIVEFRIMNSLTYHEPDVSMDEGIKKYFESIEYQN